MKWFNHQRITCYLSIRAWNSVRQNRKSEAAWVVSNGFLWNPCVLKGLGRVAPALRGVGLWEGEG